MAAIRTPGPPADRGVCRVGESGVRCEWDRGISRLLKSHGAGCRATGQRCHRPGVCLRSFPAGMLNVCLWKGVGEPGEGGRAGPARLCCSEKKCADADALARDGRTHSESVVTDSTNRSLVNGQRTANQNRVAMLKRVGNVAALWRHCVAGAAKYGFRRSIVACEHGARCRSASVQDFVRSGESQLSWNSSTGAGLWSRQPGIVPDVVSVAESDGMELADGS